MQIGEWLSIGDVKTAVSVPNNPELVPCLYGTWCAVIRHEKYLHL